LVHDVVGPGAHGSCRAVPGQGAEQAVFHLEAPGRRPAGDGVEPVEGAEVVVGREAQARREQVGCR
jgi:hypothetical protein